MSRLVDAAVQEITLRIGQICSAREIDTWPFAEEPELRGQYCVETARIMLRAIVNYAEQPCEPVKYPADWWQAVKQRFAPAWFLKRWPVEYTVWEPFIVYPDIKLPERMHFVRIRQIDHLPEWPTSLS